MGQSGSGINEENHIVSGSWIAWLIDDSIGPILSVPFCLYHFVPYHFVLEPFASVCMSVFVSVRVSVCISKEKYRYASTSLARINNRLIKHVLNIS